MAEPGTGDEPGVWLVRLSIGGTGALVATSTAAAVAPGTFSAAHAAFSVVLFAVGTGALLWAYALGVSRSRTQVVDIPGLFLLSGPVAPPRTRRTFLLALAVEVVAVVAAASLRPFTQVAFGILAPMYGLGLMAAWGGRYGWFPARPAGRAS